MLNEKSCSCLMKKVIVFHAFLEDRSQRIDIIILRRLTAIAIIVIKTIKTDPSSSNEALFSYNPYYYMCNIYLKTFSSFTQSY